MNTRFVIYHSPEWHSLVAYTYQGYGWCTWEVSDQNVATMVYTRF